MPVTRGVPTAGGPHQGPARIENHLQLPRMTGIKAARGFVMITRCQLDLPEFLHHFFSRSPVASGQDSERRILGVVTIQRHSKGDLAGLRTPVCVPGYLSSPIVRFRTRCISDPTGAHMHFIAVQYYAGCFYELLLFHDP